MKTIFFRFLAAVSLMLIVFGCEHDTETEDPLVFSGRLVKHTECKVSTFDSITNLVDSLSCAGYSFNASTHRLNITHINAGFNCCPDSIFSNVSISNDTIIIQEFESDPHCYCLCLYDLFYEIDGIKAKQYQVKFIEPLIREQQPLIFGIDLSNQPVGKHCVTRHRNPWGYGN